MLVLTRRIGEEVVFTLNGETLGVVRIGDIRGDKVRIAFDFPQTVTIDRRELYKSKVACSHPNAPILGMDAV
jgi:carbon storage regulator CsrA